MKLFNRYDAIFFPLGLLLVLLLQHYVVNAQVAPQQRAYAIWDAGCIESLTPTLKTRLEAPLNGDGDPDLKHARIENLDVKLRANCMHIEVRREQ